MHPVGKALWFIESHLASDITLDDVANIAGVSRFHMTRAFAQATGHSIMRYVRARRLSEAARLLANGAADILAVALESGYSSHEAFTRAFREQFGPTPEAVRAQATLEHICIVEPLTMDQTLIENLAPPRLVNGKLLLLAGLSERYGCDNSAGIPSQWQRFLPRLGHIPGQKMDHDQPSRVAYGVCYNFDDAGNFDYLCGVEVTDFARLGDDSSHLRVPPVRYAVFTHGDHISTIRRTWNTIWNSWLPESGYKAADAPVIERYGESFDPHTGTGDIELWVALEQ